MIGPAEVEFVNGFGASLALAGVAVDLLALAVSRSQRVRMALPLPADSSAMVLHIIGLVCGAVGVMIIFLNNSW
ncbi:MAG: hypothetical protein DWI21_03035 [Planctomycetota bacterium]|nr:MAG: hypothetical protein DWI21_03035 [Planctomycetota bacterium]GDY09095.1 hypothetical protein LBMAG52_25810 [Planctomycetia bacterium]